MMWKFDSEKDDDSIYIMAHLHKKPSGAGQVQTLTYLTRCAVYNRVCVCVCVCAAAMRPGDAGSVVFPLR